MAIITALQSPQYTKLRSTSHSEEACVSFLSNRVVFAGRVNQDLSLTTSWAQFNYNSVSVGAYTDVKVGQVLVIGHVNDINTAAVTFYGRIRLAPTSSIIYCNESSANFAVGDYFWVIDSHFLQYVLSRPSTSDPDTEVELVDYDRPYQDPLPMIVGLQLAYVGYVDSSTSKLRLAFDVSASYAVKSGATISSYAYTFSSGSVVAGSVSTPYVVVDFNAGTEVWAECRVTDSSGQVALRYFLIKAHDLASNAPATGFDSLDISNDESGMSCSLSGFAGLDSLMNNTLSVVWKATGQLGGVAGPLRGSGTATVTNKALTSNVVTLTATNTFQVGQEVIVAISDAIFDGTYIITSASSSSFSYAKTHANVGSTSASGLAVVNDRNVLFVGWFTRESDDVIADQNASTISTMTATLVGVGPRLQRLTAQLLAVREAAAPSVWGEITNCTPWRAICHFLSRYTTAAQLCDVTFDDTTNAYQFPDIGTNGGSSLAAIQGIAGQITASVAFAPAGQIDIRRDATYLSTFQRGSLTTIAAWESQDLASLSRSYEPNPSYGIVDWTGAFYNGTSTLVTVYVARAPGHAQDEAAATDSRVDQILLATTSPLAALDELKQRTGDRLALLNNNETLEAEHPSHYVGVGIFPSRAILYTFTIDSTMVGTQGVNRLSYTTAISWYVEQVTIHYAAEGGLWTLNVKYRRLLAPSDPGDDITQNVPPPGEVDTFDPGLPAFDFELPEITIPDAGLDEAPASLLMPPTSKPALFNGDELITSSAAKAFWLRHVITLHKPPAVDITPPSLLGDIKQCMIDPFFTNSAIPAYLLESDGSDSQISWNPNAASPSAPGDWQDGIALGNAFTVIRATNVNGGVLIYGASTGALPPPPPPNCTVPNTFPLYSALVNGSFAAGGSTSAQALTPLGGVTGEFPGDSSPSWTMGLTRYTFATPVTVTSVKASRARASGVGGWDWGCALYDSGGSLIGVIHRNGTSPGGTSFGLPYVWVNNVTLFSGSAASVKRVDVFVSGTADLDKTRLSDVEVCYS